MAVDPIRDGGDPQVRVATAFTHELFEEHARMVYGLCRALLRDPDDADDATQATFIAAYKSLLGGNKVHEPGAWLATIARNECTARARARMREPLPLLDADLGHSDGPETELERQALVAELQRAIATLPEKQREAVVLRDLYGLHYTEVGAALGISVASVESLLFRARRSLRVSLKPLASGALAVPVAVREGIAQALPALSGIGTGGGATSGVIGVGLLAKLAGGPAAIKAAAGIAAAVTAGSIAVAGVEHRAPGGHPRVKDPRPAVSIGAAATPSQDGVAATANVADSTGGLSASQSNRGKGGGSDDNGDDNTYDAQSGASSGSAGRSGHSGSHGGGVPGGSSGGEGSSSSSGPGSDGGGTSSSGSGSGGPQADPQSGDDALGGGGSSSSGPGSGGDEPELEDGSGSSGSGSSGSSGSDSSGESGSSESSGTSNSGSGGSESSTTMATTSGSGLDASGHLDDDGSHSGHGDGSATPPA